MKDLAFIALGTGTLLLTTLYYGVHLNEYAEKWQVNETVENSNQLTPADTGDYVAEIIEAPLEAAQDKYLETLFKMYSSFGTDQTVATRTYWADYLFSLDLLLTEAEIMHISDLGCGRPYVLTSALWADGTQTNDRRIIFTGENNVFVYQDVELFSLREHSYYFLDDTGTVNAVETIDRTNNNLYLPNIKSALYHAYTSSVWGKAEGIEIHPAIKVSVDEAYYPWYVDYLGSVHAQEAAVKGVRKILEDHPLREDRCDNVASAGLEDSFELNKGVIETGENTINYYSH